MSWLVLAEQDRAKPRSSSTDGLIVYGATGYSGRRLVARACELGMRPTLGGRDEVRLAALAAEYGLEYRTVAADSTAMVARAIGGARVVLNAAGPFAATAEVIADACIRQRVHYLDLSGEPLTIDRLTRRHEDARERAVMLMPAVGFDVVPTDCLASHVKRRLPRASILRIGVTPPASLSSGSVRTLAENVGLGLTRRHGVLREVTLASMARSFDYGEGPSRSLNISLADLVTAYYSTGIPNIETYLEASPVAAGMLAMCRAGAGLLRSPIAQAWLAAVATLVPVPAPAGDGSMRVVAEASDGNGRRAIARLRTGDAYELTAFAAVEIARQALAGDVEHGFQTPARVYGSDFVLRLPNVSREDVE